MSRLCPAAHGCAFEARGENLTTQPFGVTRRVPEARSWRRWPVGDEVKPSAISEPVRQIQRFSRHRCLTAPRRPPTPPCIDETTLPDPLGRPNANMQHYTPISGTRSAPRALGRRFSARIRGPIFSRTTAAHALCRSGTRQRLIAQPSRVIPHGSDVQSRWRWPVGDEVRPLAFP